MDISQESKVVFLRGVKAALELLLQDCELMEAGFEFFDVVDFAAIYAFVYKQSSPPFIRLTGEPEERTFARRQLALQALFSIYPRPLLLIPPYQAELTNHLNSVYTIVNLGDPDVALLYREKLSRLVSQSEQFRAFHDFKRAGKGPVDAELQQAALKVAREYFPELYASLAVLKEGSTNEFRTLQRNKILKSADDLLPNCSDIDYSTDRTMEWYEKINSNRGGKRALQSHTDAMACTYLEVANARVNPHKKAVVFVSPSANVSAAVSNSLMISAGTHLKIPVIRDLTYCRLACVLKRDIVKIKENLAIASRLLELYDSPVRVEWYLQKRREQVALEWRCIENLLMARESSITTDVTDKKRLTGTDEEFLNVLNELQSVATSGDSLQQSIGKELGALQKEMDELNRLIPAISVAKAKNMYLSIRVTPKESRSLRNSWFLRRVEFPGFSDEFPMELTFTEKSMILIARAFQRLRRGRYPDEDVLSLRKQILDSTGSRETTPEHYLLAGYFLGLEGRYSAALGELEAGMAKANEHQLVELNLISAIVYRKMGHGKDAVRLLEQSLEIMGDDARIHVEISRALALRWRQRTDDDSGTQDLDCALDHLEQAVKLAGTKLSRQARCQIANVAAFIYTEKALVDRDNAKALLDEAGKHIQQMVNSLPEKEWIGRFFDTRGYFRYVEGELIQSDSREKLKTFNAAERDLEKAVRNRENFAMGANIRQEHLELVRQAIARITIPSTEDRASVNA